MATPGGSLSPDALSGLAPDVHRVYMAAFTNALGTVFEVAAVVVLCGFVLAWLIPQHPLRETVAAASSSVGHEAGEAFAMPDTGDADGGLLRGLAILANRDLQRAYIASLVNDAGLNLLPAAAWLLGRIHEQPSTDIRVLSRQNGVPLDRLEAGLAQLRDQQLIAERASERGEPLNVLTSAGHDVYDRLAAARRRRLTGLYADWPVEQRQQLADVLQRFARQLVPDAKPHPQSER
jgi:hypothetical protein